MSVLSDVSAQPSSHNMVLLTVIAAPYFQRPLRRILGIEHGLQWAWRTSKQQLSSDYRHFRLLTISQRSVRTSSIVSMYHMHKIDQWWEDNIFLTDSIRHKIYLTLFHRGKFNLMMICTNLIRHSVKEVRSARSCWECRFRLSLAINFG